MTKYAMYVAAVAMCAVPSISGARGTTPSLRAELSSASSSSCSNADGCVCERRRFDDECTSPGMQCVYYAR